MKVVLLAGGKGTRLGEESVYRPKPLVEIGDRPILWHIMQRYSKFGFHEFIICCGYKGHMIKEYFLKYRMNYSDIHFDLKSRGVEFLNHSVEPWKVSMINTGLETLTAGRIKSIKDYIGDDQEFMITYGDGISDIDINKLLKFHHEHQKLMTISITKPDGRFGTVKFDETTKTIYGFKEKARSEQSFVNIGFMVCKRKIFDFLGDGSEMLEAGPFDRLLEVGELVAYEHEGFWSPMDTIKDKEYLTGILYSGKVPWLT
jgi:glucose-1-phosphate cytidylyltransferase